MICYLVLYDPSRTNSVAIPYNMEATILLSTYRGKQQKNEREIFWELIIDRNFTYLISSLLRYYAKQVSLRLLLYYYKLTSFKYEICKIGPFYI